MARQVHDPLFVSKYKSPILISFCRLLELYVELWEADREKSICVCLAPELFMAVFSGSLSCFWGKVTSSFPRAVFLFLFHRLVYSLIARGMQGLI